MQEVHTETFRMRGHQISNSLSYDSIFKKLYYSQNMSIYVYADRSKRQIAMDTYVHMYKEKYLAKPRDTKVNCDYLWEVELFEVGKR